MNRKDLEALGLTEEQVDKVMASHGKAVNAIKAEADKVDGLNTQIADYEQQIADRDTQLNDLSEKAKDNEELTNEINNLKQANETAANEYKDKLEKQTFEHKLEKALSDAKARNVKSVMANLDLDAIKVDGDKLLGLDDQLTTLKESDDYLFHPEEDKSKTPKIVTGGNPKGGNPDVNPFTAEHWNMTEQGKIYKKDPELYKSLMAQAGK